MVYGKMGGIYLELKNHMIGVGCGNQEGVLMWKVIKIQIIMERYTSNNDGSGL